MIVKNKYIKNLLSITFVFDMYMSIYAGFKN